MSVKEKIIQLEKHNDVKFLEYQAKFYCNRRNFYIHMGLDNSLFNYVNFKKLLDEVELFLNENLQDKFSSNFPLKLIHSTKWKYYYIFASKISNG